MHILRQPQKEREREGPGHAGEGGVPGHECPVAITAKVVCPPIVTRQRRPGRGGDGDGCYPPLTLSMADSPVEKRERGEGLGDAPPTRLLKMGACCVCVVGGPGGGGRHLLPRNMSLRRL